MSAEILSVSDPAALDRAAAIIRRGGVVAVPTETFYGLAADGSNTSAVARIYDIKGRPAAMQLPLVAASLEQVAAWAGPLDGASAKAARAFWPGALSLVVGPRSEAVRVPAHAFVRALAERVGTPLTSTSANLTGEPPAETADAVVASLGDLVDAVIDGGRTPGGMPSTIADLRGPRPHLIRDGAVAWSRVLESLK